MRELLFRAYMTCTLYVDDGEYSDAEKEVKFYLDGAALYSGSQIGISWDDFHKNLAEQGFTDDEIKKLFDCADDFWDAGEWVYFTPDAIAQYTGKNDDFGNKIFSGDIVKYTRKDWSSYSEPELHDVVLIGEIVWNNEECSYKFSHPTGIMGLSFKDQRAKANIIERIGSKYVKETGNGENINC